MSETRSRRSRMNPSYRIVISSELVQYPSSMLVVSDLDELNAHCIRMKVAILQILYSSRDHTHQLQVKGFVRLIISKRENVNLLGIPSVRTMISSGGIFEYSSPLKIASLILSKCLLNTLLSTNPVGVPSIIHYERHRKGNEGNKCTVR